MSFTITAAAPTTDLTTVARVKAELEITIGDYDDVIEEIIRDASAAIVTHLYGYRMDSTGKLAGLAQQSYVETVQGHGDNYLILSFTPIIGLPTVVWLDDITQPLVDFTVDDPLTGLLYRRIGWRDTSAVGWRLAPYWKPNSGDPSYQVTYVAGWKLPRDGALRNLPSDIERACVETAKAWFLTRKINPALTMKNVGDLRLAFNKANAYGANGEALPLVAVGLLAPWQRISVGRV